MIRTHAAILAGKLIHQATSTFKLGGGSAAPGLYALKIQPELLSSLKSIAQKTVIITGTNGKTTTSRILDQMAEDQGLTIIRNATGSNLERGIASALVQHGHKKFDLAIWEVDEAAFNQVAPKLQPDLVVFLNVFRDQLDRYGEIDNVVRGWQASLPKLNNAQIIINGDDPNLYELPHAQTFGIKDQLISFENQHKTIKKVALGTEVDQVKNHGLEGIDFRISAGGKSHQVQMPIPGNYHIYDFAAAFTVAVELGLDLDQAVQSFKTFSPAFGRVEKIPLPGKKEGYIFLIKNPYGANQVLETLVPIIKPGDRFLGILNDNFADGRDVSWIWDTEWEQLAKVKHDQFVVAGSRAYDLALRLKYAEIVCSQINPNLEKAFQQATDGLEGRLFILPTYTALLSLEKLLKGAWHA